MHDMISDLAAAGATLAPAGQLVRLSEARPGDRGVIIEVRGETRPGDHGVAVDELERRLLEFGFVEGARIELIHEGAIRRDPIAVRLDDMRVALRRRDAADVWVQLDVR
jgi:ferrous iron transport protein A